MAEPQDLQQLESQQRRDALLNADASLAQMVVIGDADHHVMSSLSSFDVLSGAAAAEQGLADAVSVEDTVDELSPADVSIPRLDLPEPEPVSLPDPEPTDQQALRDQLAPVTPTVERIAPHSGEQVQRTPEEREAQIRQVREQASERPATIDRAGNMQTLAPPPADMGGEGGKNFQQKQTRGEDDMLGLGQDMVTATNESQDNLLNLLRTMITMITRHASALEDLQDRLDVEDNEDVF